VRGAVLALALCASVLGAAKSYAEPPSLYDQGTDARKSGDYEGSKKIFAAMLRKDSKSGGALEGAALACLALKQYDEAYDYLWRWNKIKPGSQYIHDLMARAQAGSTAKSASPAAQPAAAATQETPAAPVSVSTSPAEPSLYNEGWDARNRKDYHLSKEYFAKMLEKDPKSRGALEGLTLDCMSLGEYPEAIGYLEQWKKLSPNSSYVLGLLARAQRGAGDDVAALGTTVELTEADPHDLAARRKVDSIMTDDYPGVFPSGRIRKALSSEGLGTSSPQRIVYEGRYGGLRARVRATPTLDLIGGLELAEDAQRNDTGGFIYYDVLEHISTFGLEYRPKKGLFFSGEYGEDIIDNVHGAGLPGRTYFSKVKLVARAHFLDTDWDLQGSRTPYFNRGAGGNNFFSLLRDDGAKIQAEHDALGMTWRGKAGVDDYSEGTTLKTWSFQGTKESGDNLVVPSYSHSEQDFYGSAPDGRLAYVLTDRFGGRVRRLVEEKYQLSGSGGYSVYADGNRLTDASFEAIGWLPWYKELSGGYRFDSLYYKSDLAGYNSLTSFYQWLGAYWRHDWNHGLWTRIGYEHGFLWDAVRTHYDGSAWLAEIEWYRHRDLSFKAQGRVGLDTVHDQSYSAGLQARYSFQ
jgi:tetratricopeptide (TPR) repeat protein